MGLSFLMLKEGKRWTKWALSLNLADCMINEIGWSNVYLLIWAASSEFGINRICEQRRFRRACTSAQSRQNLRCSLIQAMSQEEPSERKPDPWPLWMAGHAQLKFVMTECSKTQIRLTRPKKWHNNGDNNNSCCYFTNFLFYFFLPNNKTLLLQYLLLIIYYYYRLIVIMIILDMNNNTNLSRM